MTDNIRTLRPKAKDPTGAQRQARFRRKRKSEVTARAINGATPAAVTVPAAIAHDTPPPQEGRDIPVISSRNGSTGVTVATLTAALALATVSGGFSISGMTAVFVGATVPVIGMGVALELGKLSAIAWLGHQRRSASRALKLSITVLVTVLMTLNAVGCFGYLSRAHIAQAVAGDVGVTGRSADIEARLAMQAGVVADLDRRIAQIDNAIARATEKGRTSAAMKLAEDQRRTRSDLAAERVREGKALATLQVEKAGIEGERRKVEADLGPVRYLAILLGADDQDVLRYFILVVAVLLDPAAVLLLLAAARR
jgi:hypothetical protein